MFPEGTIYLGSVQLLEFAISDATAIKQYYAIFDGPARWKAVVRTPQEAMAPGRKLNVSFKVREGGKPLATTHLN